VQLQAHQQSAGADQSKLEARIAELQAAHTAVGQKVAALTEALARETRLREDAEHHANEIGKHRAELETELAQNKATQAELREQLETSQKQLQSQQQSSGAEQSKLEARIKELDAAQTALEQKVVSLTESLGEETKRKQGVEQQASDLAKHRTEMETQL